MAIFKDTILTVKAHNLIAKSLAGNANISFTRVATSSYDYKSFSQSKLEELSILSDIKQYVPIDKVEKLGNASVNISVKITNQKLNQGYYVNAIGLFATDPDEGEILYSITVSETADYFPADNGVNCSGINLDLITEVSNSSNVTLNVNYSGYATNEDIEKVNAQLNDNVQEINNVKNDIFTNYAKKTDVNTLADNKANKVDLQATNTELQIQKARMDSFTSLTQGSTTGDAELRDIRIGANGKTYANAGASVREQFKNIENKISYNIPIHQYTNLDDLTSKADSNIYITNYKYKSGYIKSLSVRVNGDTVQNGKIYLYKLVDNIYKYVEELATINGIGDILINIDKYISYDFYIAISCSGLVYKDIKTDYNSAFIGTSVKDISANAFSSNLVFGYSVNYISIIDSLDNISKDISTIPILPNKSSDNPIIWNFENNVLKTDFFILNSQTKVYDYFQKSLQLSIIADNTWTVYTLLYNENTKEIYLGKWSDSAKISNVYIVSLIYTNNRHGFIFNANADYIKIIIKPSFNTDDGTTATGDIIPKYGERSIITREIQKSKWYGKAINFLGDSLTKGENPEDSYLRMKDDNIASIVKEELGFITTRNYGIGGTLISGSNNQSFVNRYNNMDNLSDVNIIWGGTNDYYHGVQLGSVDDLSDNTKFIPALYNLIVGMQKKYPGKPLGVISPPHLYGTDDRYKDNIARNGYKLIDLINAMELVCMELGVPFLNLYKEMGFTPHIEEFKNLYQPDGVHFTIDGMRKFIARRIVEFIEKL